MAVSFLFLVIPDRNLFVHIQGDGQPHAFVSCLHGDLQVNRHGCRDPASNHPWRSRFMASCRPGFYPGIWQDQLISVVRGRFRSSCPCFSNAQTYAGEHSHKLWNQSLQGAKTGGIEDHSMGSIQVYWGAKRFTGPLPHRVFIHEVFRHIVWSCTVTLGGTLSIVLIRRRMVNAMRW